MTKAILLLMALAGLTACADYEGRKTNCWSGGALSFVETAPGPVDCSNWIEISG